MSNYVTKPIVILGLMLFFAVGSAQNLVKNPSFEAYLNCPERLGNFDADVKYWSTPTQGSTDYFNGCSTAMGTPKNFNGSQPANFGTGYAGLYLYAPDNYREYLQVELSQTLIKGKKYSISFYVSLAERSDFAVKEFGILFSHDKLDVPGKRELSKGKIYRTSIENYNFMEIGYSNFYSDTKDWILVNTQFVAKGTENYLTMGNFKPNARTRMFKTKKGAKKGAYYYVDMFKVAAVNKADESTLAIKNDMQLKTNFALDKIHVFENVLFDFDTFSVLESAKKEMQELFQYVSGDVSLQITIQGHTDSVGSEFYNTSLSRKRARAVADYLQKLGLPDDRIFWEGHGGTKPIATNNTEAGRQQNRRVEFLITKRDQLNK